MAIISDNEIRLTEATGSETACREAARRAWIDVRTYTDRASGNIENPEVVRHSLEKARDAMRNATRYYRRYVQVRRWRERLEERVVQEKKG